MKTIVIVMAMGILAGCKPGTTKAKEPAPDLMQKGMNDSLVLSYFITSLIEKVKTSVKNYDKLGLAGGVDGFVLIETYPKLLPSDFSGVRALGGEYSVKDGKLLYTGNAASNSPVLTRAGMQTLAGNCAGRLRLPLTSRADVAQLLTMLEQ